MDSSTLRDHLKERQLDISRYSGIHVADDVVTFTLWNLSGMFIGYQQYRPGAEKKKMKNDPREGRYYTSLHGNKGEKPFAVWGPESLSYDPSVIVIVEGIFDACRIHTLNVPAVALLNSSFKQAKNWLTCLGRKVYKVEDDHESKLGPYQNLPLPIGRGDVGECTDAELSSMLVNRKVDQFLSEVE